MTNTQPNRGRVLADTAIREYVARYSSNRLTDAQRDSMMPDIRKAVIDALPNSDREARSWLTIVTGFIADVAPADGGLLDSHFNDAAISLWVSTSMLAGAPRKSLKTRRGVLNRILRAHRGVASDASKNERAPRSPSRPLEETQLGALLEASALDSRSALRGFFAHIAAGVPLGIRGVRFKVEELELASSGESWRLAAYRSACALAGDYLLGEDWKALKDVASSLDIRLTPSIAMQTFRSLAVTDEGLSLAERLNTYRISGTALDTIGRRLPPISGEDLKTTRIWLRNGHRSGLSACSSISVQSGRPQVRGAEGDARVLTRKTSRAAAKRLAIEHATAAAEKRLRAQPVLDYIASFTPDQDDAIWDSIAETVRSAVAACGFTSIESARKHAVVLAAFLRWRALGGHSTDVESSLTFEIVDAYFVHGMPDLAERSQRDYRSRLRHLAEKCNPSVKAPPSLRLGHNQVNPPYNENEEREVRRMAITQTVPEVRRRLCAIVGLCGGCGISSTEIRALLRRDISIDEDGTITVKITGARPRRVVVRRIYEGHVLVAIEGLRPDRPVLPPSKSDSPITAILKGADVYEGCPAIDTRTLRTTWICWLMRQNIPLQVAFAASGLQSSRTFYDMLEHLPASDGLSELRDGGAK
ncbi:MAG: hypothetical protein WA860_10590 [Acidimicrobiales bacterium]